MYVRRSISLPTRQDGEAGGPLGEGAAGPLQADPGEAGPAVGVGETSFLKTRRFEASFRREMGNDTEFEASFRRKMGKDTNSRRVFGEKRETIRYKIHHFYTKNKKNWGL